MTSKHRVKYVGEVRGIKIKKRDHKLGRLARIRRDVDSGTIQDGLMVNGNQRRKMSRGVGT